MLSSSLKRWGVFNAVGLGGIVVQLGVLALLAATTRLHYLAATALAVEAAVLHNFWWHQRWTWKDRPPGSRHDTLARLARFHLLNGAISLGGNLAIVALLTGTLHVPPLLANMAAIVTCALLNYAASDLMVFRSTAPLVALAFLFLAPLPAAAGPSPATIAAWQRYDASIDACHAAASSRCPFFLEDRQGESWRDEVIRGGIRMASMAPPPVPDGRLHHWVGSVFVPRATLGGVLERLEQNTGQESRSYEDVLASRLLWRDGDHLRVFMKLRRTNIVTVTYNTEHDVVYRRLGPTRATSRSVATRIAELAGAGTAHEREKAPGDDNGFLWRLNAYWRYEETAGGVLIECESVSLSRAVPMLLRPIANPLIDRIARESLERTLRTLKTLLVP
jgi:putative flippase GtrA